MRFLVVLGILMVRAVALTLPGQVWRAVTGRYTREYVLGRRTVTRPAHFRSRDHKIAFEDIGNYLSDGLTRDVMLVYKDQDLLSKNRLGPTGIPLEIWHEVLAWFHEEGIIELHWELEIPMGMTRPSYARPDESWSPDMHRMVPGHRPDGTRIIDPATAKQGAEAAEPETFSPGFLSTAQKDELIGKPYRVHADGAFIFERGEDPFVTVVLEDRHFSRLYSRPRGFLSEEDIDKAANRLGNGLLWAGLAKSSR